MYSQIARNKRRAVVYIVLFFAVWIGIGAVCGLIVAASTTHAPGATSPRGADVAVGMVIAGLLALTGLRPSPPSRCGGDFRVGGGARLARCCGELPLRHQGGSPKYGGCGCRGALDLVVRTGGSPPARSIVSAVRIRRRQGSLRDSAALRVLALRSLRSLRPLTPPVVAGWGKGGAVELGVASLVPSDAAAFEGDRGLVSGGRRRECEVALAGAAGEFVGSGRA